MLMKKMKYEHLQMMVLEQKHEGQFDNLNRKKGIIKSCIRSDRLPFKISKPKCMTVRNKNSCWVWEDTRYGGRVWRPFSLIWNAYMSWKNQIKTTCWKFGDKIGGLKMSASG